MNEMYDLYAVDDNSLIGLNDAWDVSMAVLLNPKLLEENDYGYPYDHYFQLSEGIKPYTTSSRRGVGSWERMYLTQPPVICDVSPFIADKVNRLSDRDLIGLQDPGASEDLGPMSCVPDSKGEPAPLRAVMDDAEEAAVKEYGHTIAWSTSLLSSRGLEHGEWWSPEELEEVEHE